jgi:putative tryptophan/tyrosine transport system substrate-binding protein
LRVNAFIEGLRATERRQIDLLSRVAEGNPDRLPGMAQEIVAHKVDVFVAIGPATLRAARDATRALPIVALDLESDPVESGLVASLSRPGGNITGVFFDFPDFSTKWLELLREVAPKLTRLGIMWDPSTGPLQLRAVERPAGSMNFTIRIIEVKDLTHLGQTFASARNEGLEGLLLLSSPLFGSHPAISAKLALEHRFPAVTMFPEFPHTGGLLAYGPNIAELYRQTGAITAKVLAGAAPADLPVERPTRFQLVINLKTAKALGIDVPPFLQQMADEVIE